jgi:hypothetical protein
MRTFYRIDEDQLKEGFIFFKDLFELGDEGHAPQPGDGERDERDDLG